MAPVRPTTPDAPRGRRVPNRTLDSVGRRGSPRAAPGPSPEAE